MQKKWWKESVIYQIYPRSFKDSNGDGIGDLRGIIEKLDYLKELGVDVVWLSPVYKSPNDDMGYDISDYQDIMDEFGTLADWEALLRGLHARGIKLVMDLVVNHTSDEHPWFVESRQSKDNPRRDWYYWRPGQDGAEPNNWVSFFRGSAWQRDDRTGEYYLHLFSKKQPDLNWENPEVRHAVYDMMRWWLDRDIDGFRMDVINLISKDPALPDGKVRPGERFATLGRQVVDGPRIHEYLAEMHREVFTDVERPLLLVGETLDVSIEEARKYTAQERKELDMVFQLEHLQIDRGASKWDVLPFDMRLLRGSLAAWQEGLADVGWNSLYWDNHDRPRVVSRFGDDGEFRERSAKLLATVLHLQRGTPYIYQGQELGMSNFPFTSIEQFADIESINYYEESVAMGEDPEAVMASLRARSRDNGRTPMQWDASPHAGFTTGRPWLPVHPNFQEVNAASQVDDPTSVFSYYRDLIRLRHDEPVVALGDFTLDEPDHSQLFAFTRRHDGEELRVVANFSGEVAEVPPRLRRATADSPIVLANVEGPHDSTTLEPWEARVLLRRQPSPAARPR